MVLFLFGSAFNFASDEIKPMMQTLAMFMKNNVDVDNNKSNKEKNKAMQTSRCHNEYVRKPLLVRRLDFMAWRTLFTV